MAKRPRTPRKAGIPADGAVYAARSLRGLEEFVALDLRSRLDARILSIGHREVRFHADLDDWVLRIRSADDVFLEVGSISQVPHTRDGLAFLAKVAAELPLIGSLSRLRALRKGSGGRVMEVVASFLGRRNYSRLEIEDHVGVAIADRAGLEYRPHAERSEAADVSWRVHIREGEAFVGLRVGPHPLHRRDYRIRSRTGALHPPLAFCMAMISNLRAGLRCFDPCCGVGTTLIEAQSVEPGLLAIGMDIDPQALAGARDNADRARSSLVLARADAGRLPLPDRSIDRIISNPPWAKAVPPAGMLASHPAAFFQEAARVLAPGGVAVVLGPLESPVSGGDLRVVWETRVHVFGQWASLRVLAAAAHDWQPPSISAGSPAGAAGEAAAGSRHEAPGHAENPVGTTAIAATSINIICTAETIDASTAVPIGVARRGIRFSPVPGSQE
jgi:23S rRNA G2445 N2-methylase RlmL